MATEVDILRYKTNKDTCSETDVKTGFMFTVCLNLGWPNWFDKACKV